MAKETETPEKITETKKEKILKKPKPKEVKYNSTELAEIMGIHPYRLDTIRINENLKEGFETTPEELRKLYKKHF